MTLTLALGPVQAPTRRLQFATSPQPSATSASSSTASSDDVDEEWAQYGGEVARQEAIGSTRRLLHEVDAALDDCLNRHIIRTAATATGAVATAAATGTADGVADEPQAQQQAQQEQPQNVGSGGRRQRRSLLAEVAEAVSAVSSRLFGGEASGGAATAGDEEPPVRAVSILRDDDLMSVVSACADWC